MHVYISADIEGISGIASWDEATPDHPDYGPFRKRMTEQVAAACVGAQRGGASRITVRDGHGSGRNLVHDGLPEATSLIRAWSGDPMGMVEGLGPEHSALACVGFHAPCKHRGNPLSHTWSGRLAHLSLNGERLSEFRLCTTTAHSLGIPTVFLAGDQAICAEANASLPHVITVPTMTAAGSAVTAAHPEVIRRRIEAGMAEAMGRVGAAPIPDLPDSWVFEVRFRKHTDAYRASFYPGARLLRDDVVCLETDRWLDVLTAIQFW